MIRIYIYAGIVAFLCAVSGWTGHKLTAASYQSDIIREQTATAKAVDEAAAKANQHAEELEKAKAKREIIYQTITKTVDRIVDRPVYRSDCIDDDGMHAIDAAITGTPSDTSQPDAAMPAADAAGRQDGR